MIELCTCFSDKEKNILLKYAGKSYEILSCVEGDSYVLSEKGDYLYNECFSTTKTDYFAQQKYEKVIPFRIIKFFHFYFMNKKEEKNIWYRGRKDDSGNWEYDCCADSLEEIFDSL